MPKSHEKVLNLTSSLLKNQTAELLNFVVGFYFTEPQTWTWVLRMCLADICIIRSRHHKSSRWHCVPCVAVDTARQYTGGLHPDHVQAEQCTWTRAQGPTRLRGTWTQRVLSASCPRRPENQRSVAATWWAGGQLVSLFVVRIWTEHEVLLPTRENHQLASSTGWWRRDMLASLVSINEVNLRWAQLVLGWVTVSGFDSRRRHFIFRYVTNHPGRLSLLPSVGR